MGLFSTSVNTAPLRKGANDAQGFLKTGKKQAKKALLTGQTQSVNSIAQGLSQAKPQYEQAAGNFAPYMQSGSNLNALYEQSLTPGAPDPYRETEGFKYLQGQGEQAALRNNASIGGVASGNVLTDLAKFDTGLADTYRQQYLDNLFRGSGQGLTAAAGQAGVLTGLGDMFNQGGRDTAGIYTGTAGKLADVFSGANTAMANNQSMLGANLTNANAQSQANKTALLNSIIGATGEAAGMMFPGAGAKLGNKIFGTGTA